MGEPVKISEIEQAVTDQRYFAHTIEGHGPEAWEPLIDHLRLVAEGDSAQGLHGASHFAAAFGAEAWGRALGWWHDVGKYSHAFQAYLLAAARDPAAVRRGSVDHSTAGAYHAMQRDAASGHLLAYCIAGHHGGLPNTTAPIAGEQDIKRRLQSASQNTEIPGALQRAPAKVLDVPTPRPPRLCWEPSAFAFQLAFFGRMLFSCLVDADFLATEWFMQPERTRQRRGTSRMPTPEVLAEQLGAYLEGLRREDSIVNRWRARVLDACVTAAAGEPGLYTLTVPTGGGKTLSSLAFALNHAQQHGLRRVVYAIPYTSIIEQNADVFRTALGKWCDAVLEHHSQVARPPEDDRAQDAATVRQRLAAENWDAPLIVTTNVQLFESLFANQPSRCRKLHRLARSVIVLDEAQALPPNLLAPTLAAMRELVTNYGCTIVLCTATQPALEKRNGFSIGLDHPTPIVTESAPLFDAFRRVQVEQRPTPVSDETLVDDLAGESQVLCIVNTRSHAADLFTRLTERLGETRTFERAGREQPAVGSCLHLSAQMCPRHRSAVLRLIRRRLKCGEPCRVISTQLVEAGVDVDFPVVYRAMAGLDSIAQAAGRCNREGRLADAEGKPRLGRVVVFDVDPNEHRPPPFVRPAIDDARAVLPSHADPLAPQAQHAYFAEHYWKKGGDGGRGWDRPPGTAPGDPGVMDCFKNNGKHLQFREAARLYRLIEDSQIAIVVPYGRRGDRLNSRLHQMPEPPGRAFHQQLQRFVVTVQERGAEAMLNNRVLLETHGILTLGNSAAYDRRLGLRLNGAGLDAEGLMV